MAARRRHRRSGTRSLKDWTSALTHEAGNLLAAVRMCSHFVGGESDPRERAQLARRIDLLVVEAGAILSQLGHLGREGALASVPVSALLEAVGSSLADGVAPERLRIASGARLPAVRVDMDATHAWLVWVACGALLASDETKLRIGAAVDGRRVRLRILDEAPPIAAVAPSEAQRGRELALAVGDALFRERRARIDAAPRRGGNRIELWLPTAPRKAGAG